MKMKNFYCFQNFLLSLAIRNVSQITNIKTLLKKQNFFKCNFNHTITYQAKLAQNIILKSNREEYQMPKGRK